MFMKMNRGINQFDVIKMVESEYYKNCLLGIFETALTFCTFRREKTPKTSLLVLRRMVGSYVRTLFTNSYGMQGRHALFQNGNIKMKV